MTGETTNRLTSVETTPRRVTAAIIDHPGASPRLGTVDLPPAPPGRTVVKVMASPLNPLDLHIASGTFHSLRHQRPVRARNGVCGHGAALVPVRAGFTDLRAVHGDSGPTWFACHPRRRRGRRRRAGARRRGRRDCRRPRQLRCRGISAADRDGPAQHRRSRPRPRSYGDRRPTGRADCAEPRGRPRGRCRQRCDGIASGAEPWSGRRRRTCAERFRRRVERSICQRQRTVESTSFSMVCTACRCRRRCGRAHPTPGWSTSATPRVRRLRCPPGCCGRDS